MNQNTLSTNQKHHSKHIETNLTTNKNSITIKLNTNKKSKFLSTNKTLYLKKNQNNKQKMYNDLTINPLHKTNLNLTKPLKQNYISQGKIKVLNNSSFNLNFNLTKKYEYTNLASTTTLIAYKRFCGYEIQTQDKIQTQNKIIQDEILQNKIISTLKRNLIGSKYKSTNLSIKFATSFFGRKKPRSFIVEHNDIIYVNKEPFYNKETNSYSLNFNGRVTIPSVKNFQLVHPNDKTYLVLTFGKISNDTYVMDYKFPLSAVTAFQICLSAIDNKYFCD